MKLSFVAKGSDLMRQSAGRLLFAFVFLFVAGATAQAQDMTLRMVVLERLVQEDPGAAIKAIDQLYTEAAASDPADPRVLFDLVRLKADLLLERDQKAEGARWLAEAAAIARRNRELLDIDPGPIHQTIAQLLEELGDLRNARAQMSAVLGLQQDGAEPGAVLAETYGELARLSAAMGREADQQRYEQAAANALIPQDEATRSSDSVGYREVEVFYATDRARTGDAEPETFYGWGRGTLELGTLIVTVPDTRTKGLVESPSIWRLEFGPNPAKHVVLRSVTPVKEDLFYTTMQSRIEARSNKELFVFIHGYNVDFEQAAKRAAQISYDMNYGGLPVLYSWPSAGSTVGYISDTAVVRLSGRRLSQFLEQLVARSGASTVHIVAHSMGNRALTDALELMAARRDVETGEAPVFGQILFAAPDVDAGLFAQMIQTIRPLAQRLTLYASHEDWALETSRRLHGNAPRAGQGGEYVLVDDNIDSVDMSELGEDMLAHSYFADDSSALADMMSLFWQNASPQRRCGLEETKTEGIARPFWTYKRGACSSQNLIDAMALMASSDVQSGDEVRQLLEKAVDDDEVRNALAPVLTRMVED